MKILIADDEIQLAEVLAKILRKNNYSVTTACDGEEALSLFKYKEFDVIILDIMMPKMDGIAVLKEIRKINTKIPVLMLTAKTQVEDKVLGLDCGADDYLEKPFDTRELLARIRSITRNKDEVDNKIQFGNTFLDNKTFELSTKTNHIKLTNKEFLMMELLMNNPKIIIPSERFLEKIWGEESDIDINVVWVYISYLRKKLIALSSNVEIKVSRNVGYSLEIKNDK